MPVAKSEPMILPKVISEEPKSPSYVMLIFVSQIFYTFTLPDVSAIIPMDVVSIIPYTTKE